jgi:hypothetical protein
MSEAAVHNIRIPASIRFTTSGAAINSDFDILSPIYWPKWAPDNGVFHVSVIVIHRNTDNNTYHLSRRYAVTLVVTAGAMTIDSSALIDRSGDGNAFVSGPTFSVASNKLRVSVTMKNPEGSGSMLTSCVINSALLEV